MTVVNTPPIVRRNIHTYPFKYSFTDAEEFFAPSLGSIYIHIPFCTKKCHFCEYVVTTSPDLDLRASYVDALCKEIKRFTEIGCFPKYRIDALYIGGGTPGLLEGKQLARILDTCRETFEFTSTAEIGVEFDPACVSLDKLNTLTDAGFDRLSVGVQSFDEEVLKINNRPHELADIRNAFDAIAKSSFTHTNVDLIYPLVGGTMENWVDSVDAAIELSPACVTAYPLEVWPGTPYHKWLSEKKHALPTYEVELEMSVLAYDKLESAGFKRRSSSGYYHPDRTERYCHFLDYYWRTWPMIGFGVSSKSVVGDRLYTNVRSIGEYIERCNAGQDVLSFSTRMTRDQEMKRVIIRGLKMCDVDKAAFRDRFGVPMESVFGTELDQLVNAGWLTSDDEKIELTREGQKYGRSVYALFYTEEDLREPNEGEVQFGISDLITD